MFQIIQTSILYPFKKERLNISSIYQLFLFPIRRKNICTKSFATFSSAKRPGQNKSRIKTFEKDLKAARSFFYFLYVYCNCAILIFRLQNKHLYLKLYSLFLHLLFIQFKERAFISIQRKLPDNINLNQGSFSYI